MIFRKLVRAKQPGTVSVRYQVVIINGRSYPVQAPLVYDGQRVKKGQIIGKKKR